MNASYVGTHSTGMIGVLDLPWARRHTAFGPHSPVSVERQPRHPKSCGHVRRVGHEFLESPLRITIHKNFQKVTSHPSSAIQS
jgi:hypothetical protein